MKFRFWCILHAEHLQNNGNGRFMFPTSSDLPNVDEHGWMELDFSEYTCPRWSEADDCRDHWDIELDVD